ncbi:lysophospholipid acyltransferase family protein [Aeromicrobium wangtongii]|uniref:lysophospholipid acyltransferase family protein n=1 Tax=Aeromicrobium wangtongii TaxID=2969247 RepID=UPI002016F3CB|nr:lysophospholipid acyltransferase family protein [Aeromicrobium wangtongii]MCL3818655.1 1-acyl-sn-glycerol-3-phosphate acyltransferase [Aeromicrobium wangtongii]
MSVTAEQSAPVERGLPEGALRFVRNRARGHFHRRWEIHERGQSKVPTSGPVILASNHIGWLDGPLLVATAPRPVHAMVKEEEFAGRTGWLLRLVAQIKVSRGRNDTGAVREAVRSLRAGQCVLIYPESRRGDGEFKQFKNGVTYLALVTGAPVVPVAIFGTRQRGEGPQAKPARGTRLDIVYGDPIQFPMRAWPRDRGMLEDAGDQIHDHLRAHVSQAKDALKRDLPGPLPTGSPDV